jgi:hypothetical protein
MSRPKLTDADLRAISDTTDRQENLLRKLDAAYDAKNVLQIMELLKQLLGKTVTSSSASSF